MTSSRIDDYERGVILGVGTVGTIYQGTHRESGYRVAIKILHPGVSQDKLIRARFRREMSVLNRLNHPNVIAYYGGGEAEDGLLYYIMELVEGGTLRALIREKGPLTSSSAALPSAVSHGASGFRPRRPDSAR